MDPRRDREVYQGKANPEPRREGVRMGSTSQKRGGRRLAEATRVVRSIMD